MLQIRNRYNRDGELINPKTYVPQHIVALETFLAEMYSDCAETEPQNGNFDQNKHESDG